MCACVVGCCPRSLALAACQTYPPGGAASWKYFRFDLFIFLGRGDGECGGGPRKLGRGSREPSPVGSWPFGLRSSPTLVSSCWVWSSPMCHAPRALSPRCMSRTRTAVDQGRWRAALGSPLPQNTGCLVRPSSAQPDLPAPRCDGRRATNLEPFPRESTCPVAGAGRLRLPLTC